MGSALMTASFNGRPLLMTPTTKEEAKTNKLNTSPLNFSHENAEEEAHKRKMRMEKYNVNGGSSGPG